MLFGSNDILRLLCTLDADCTERYFVQRGLSQDLIGNASQNTKLLSMLSHLYFEPKYWKEHRRGPDWIVIEGNRAVSIECRTSILRKETKSRVEFDDVQKDPSTNYPFPCLKSIDLYSKHLGRCASHGSRWEWQEAVEQGIKLYQDGAVDAILLPEVDRETRNPLISVPILNLALDAGVPIFFAEEQLQLDPRDPDAIQKYTDAVAKSCTYLATMVRKCRGGRFDRAQDGKLPSNTKMSGFDIIDGRRVPNHAEAAALSEAAKIALSTGRLRPGVDWLNEKGFRTTHGYPFTTVTLRGLFRNRALIGETTINFKEKTVVLKHDGILDVATFKALQAMLDEYRRAQRSDTFYALSGLVYCGNGGKFEPTKTGTNRYYYRCENHSGEKAWRKDALEREVYEAFSRYLQKRESQREYLELAQKSCAKLGQDLAQVENDIVENDRQWETLLKKDLADYPDIIIKEEKQRLTAERRSLLQAKAKIESELESLPQVDPVEVDQALTELAKPWRVCNTGGYYVPHPMSWERASVASGNWKPDMPRKLSEEQAHLLRETLLKLNCRITISNRVVFVGGKLPLASVRVKQTAS